MHVNTTFLSPSMKWKRLRDYCRSSFFPLESHACVYNLRSALLFSVPGVSLFSKTYTLLQGFWKLYTAIVTQPGLFYALSFRQLSDLNKGLVRLLFEHISRKNYKSYLQFKPSILCNIREVIS